ncbi:MAG: MATE family efflux transporter [Proteobacteria bacterium]|nr:MATE family efflux transporter [Pseudomonadota bacterium]MDA0856410.1 MATE family efflux transporter [Pseudomonadota bacterium]
MDLGNEQIPKLVRQIAIPASVGMFFNTMYNVVDTFWAGQLSPEALAALSLSLIPFIGLLAVGIGLGQGASALISNAMGAEDDDQAGRLMAQALSLAFVVSVVVVALGLVVTPFLYRGMGASGEYLELSLDYMNWLIYGSGAFIFAFVINSGLNAQGDTKSYRNALICGFFANIILDPLFLFGWGPFPALGLEGIAISTVLIELGVVTYLSVKLLSSKLGGNLSTRKFSLQVKLIVDLVKQGFPASLSILFISLNFYVILHFISDFGKTSVAAYGVSTRIVQVMLLPSIGLNTAALSLTGFNFGANNLERVNQTWRTCFNYSLLLTAFGGILLFCFPEFLLRLFTDSEEIIEVGPTLLRVEAVLLTAYTTIFLGTSVLQGLKKPMFGMILSIYRLIVAPVIFFWLFSDLLGYGLNGIWAGIFLTTASGALITWFYLKRTLTHVTSVQQ